MTFLRKRWSANRYAKVKAAGICAYCQRVPARPESIVCQPCQDLTNQRARKRKYGVDHATFIAMLERQDARCAICSDDISVKAHVDHDHSTGEVRGLLCGHCNRGLGAFRDSPETLFRAIEYLDKRKRLEAA